MTELELYKFINNNELEITWNCYENKDDELILWIPFYYLDEFTKMIGYNYLSDGGIEVNLQEDCTSLDINPICEYFDINSENILGKED